MPTPAPPSIAADAFTGIDEAKLRELLGHPISKVANKIRNRIGELEQRFIAHSPFLVISTSDGAGHLDASPRGDSPGFVKVLDDRTLAIPDRLGNKLADSFSNLLQQPGIGLLFFVPGVRETLRINGDAVIVDDATLLDRMSANNKRPAVATVVTVSAVYLHCGKSLIRSGLWDPAMQRYGQALTLGRHVEALQAVADGDPTTNTQEIETASAADQRELY
jgi:uncharacterized protein